MNKDAIITDAHTFCRGKRHGFWIETNKGVFTFEAKEKDDLYTYTIVDKMDLTNLVGATLHDWRSYTVDGPYDGHYDKTKFHTVVLETSRGDFPLSLQFTASIYDDKDVWFRIRILWEERLFL